MAPHRAAVVFSGLLGVALLTGPARAGDIGVPAPDVAAPAPYFTIFQELRVGAYAHNVTHNENAPVDVSFETLSSQLGWNGFSNPYVNWFFSPRINLGAMINVEGKTSYAFGGFTWRIPIYKAFFFEGEFGGAVNNAPTHPEVDRVDMGCRLTFRESGGFGYQFNEHVDLIVNIEHVSHASFCTHINPGLTQVGARIGYKF